jgi:Tol biopolymer transport system component
MVRLRHIFKVRIGWQFTVGRQSGFVRIRFGLKVVIVAVIALLIARITFVIEHEKRSSAMISSVQPPATIKSLGLGSATLIYVSNRSGTYNIYAKALSSGKLMALTTGSSDNMNPEICPDNKRFVFYSNRSGSNQVYALDLANPTHVTQLTNDVGGVQNYDPTFTVDGKQILFKKTDVHGNFGDIWEMNEDGSSPRDLTPTLTTQHIEAWKPVAVNDQQAVITERLRQGVPYSDNLFLLNLASGAQQALTNNSLSNWFPDYAPQSGNILFVTKQTVGGNDVLATINMSGASRNVMVHIPGDSNDPSWSTDGRSIVFVNDSGSGYFNVYAARADGSGVMLLDKSPSGSTDLSPLLIQ